MSSEKEPQSTIRSPTLSIPELAQSKIAVLNTLASEHSRRTMTKPSYSILNRLHHKPFPLSYIR